MSYLLEVMYFLEDNPALQGFKHTYETVEEALGDLQENYHKLATGEWVGFYLTEHSEEPGNAKMLLALGRPPMQHHRMFDFTKGEINKND